MLLPSLVALILLTAPSAADPPRGSFDSVVPRLPDGYGPGRVSIRVHAVPMPEAAAEALVGDLFARTGIAITETQGVRIEITLPEDVRFESFEARVVDGLVLAPAKKSLISRVGGALLSILRLILVGQLIDAADDLAVPGVAWAAALGIPSPDDELVKLSTSESLSVQRGASTFSDHGEFSVCRSMLALSPWTELVELRLRGRDLTTGKDVAFLIPRLQLHGTESPEPDSADTARWVMAASR